MHKIQIHIKRISNAVSLLFLTGLFLQPSASLAQKEDLLGVVTADQIMNSDHLFKIHTQRYEPNTEALQYLNNYQDTLSIQIFFGSWCRESKKYLPGLIKTLKLSAPEKVAIKYIGVNAKKNFPDLFLKMYNIKYIPTVVIQKGNEEIGRIEEAPTQPIEIELVEILKKEKQF